MRGVVRKKCLNYSGSLFIIEGKKSIPEKINWNNPSVLNTFLFKRFSLKKIKDPITKLIKIFAFNIWLLKTWPMEREMDFSPILPARKNKKKCKKDRRKRNKSIISVVSSPDEEKRVKRCVEGTIKDFRGFEATLITSKPL